MDISAISKSKIPFKKTLAAKTAVLSHDKSYPCNIYKLDSSDTDYFRRLIRQKYDEGFHYLYYIDADYFFSLSNENPEEDENAEFFVMEDERNKCLGYLETVKTKNGDDRDVKYIESFSPNSPDRWQKKYKYVGETLLTFVAKIIKNDNFKQKFCVQTPSEEAFPFYKDKCGFVENRQADDIYCIVPPLLLPKNNLEKLISQNEEHTGKKMEIFI